MSTDPPTAWSATCRLNAARAMTNGRGGASDFLGLRAANSIKRLYSSSDKVTEPVAPGGRGVTLTGKLLCCPFTTAAKNTTSIRILFIAHLAFCHAEHRALQ